MATNLSIKNVPDTLAARLRERAKRNHRSLQGEVLAILEAAEGADGAGGLTVREMMDRGRALGLATPDEGTAWIREARDSR
ncbi:MAG: Arc family DNA-binding protein [Dehalococcoidia bacterium]